MMERVLEQKRAITVVLEKDRKARHLIPTWQDIDVLESVNKALHPLQDFTDALSGEAYISVSFVKPVLHLFQTSLLAVDDEDTDLTKTIKRKIMDYLNSKYNNPVTQEILDAATFLDPRFKVGYMEAARQEYIKEKLAYELMRLTATTAASSTSSPSAAGSDTNSSTELTCEPNKKRKISLGSFFKTSTPAATPIPTIEVIQSEMNSYILSPKLDAEGDSLTWWSSHKMNYPHLSVLARKYLCIQATSAASERVFSASGNIVNCLRSCLKPEMVNMLVFLNKNQKRQ